LKILLPFLAKNSVATNPENLRGIAINSALWNSPKVNSGRFHAWISQRETSVRDSAPYLDASLTLFETAHFFRAGSPAHPLPVA
jgi:hypothetical protein